MLMLMMLLILIILYLLSKTQNCNKEDNQKYNQKLSKLIRKGFEILVYWSKYKAKSKDENTTKEYRYFLE